MKPSEKPSDKDKAVFDTIVLAILLVAMISLIMPAVCEMVNGNTDVSTSEEFRKLLEIPEVALYVDSQNYWDNQKITQNELLEIKEYQKNLEFRESVKSNLETQQKQPQ